MSPRSDEHEYEEVEIDIDMPVYSTGVVCKILEIPVWVLKKLDKEGIVCPPRDNEGQARLYSQCELNKLQHCWYFMKEHNVKVEGLKVILEMEAGTFEIRKKRK